VLIGISRSPYPLGTFVPTTQRLFCSFMRNPQGRGFARSAFYCLGLCWSGELGLSVPFCFFFSLLFLLLSFESRSLV
jgi:hypothetical protein